MSFLGVVLDTSVLFPAVVRDTLLRSADAGMYRPYWSDEILEELRRNLVSTGRTTEEQAQRLVDMLRRAFPEASITGYEEVVNRMTNHPKDRHVLAAAVVAQAQIIVTDNLRDFPETALAPFTIEAQSADTFLTGLFEEVPERMVQIVIEQTAAMRLWPKTYSEVLDSIGKQAPTFAKLVSERLE
ncbi:MAG TPA: PIN domain-containing protein [Herpetosiphonaceae bacterium]|nr:PIN domain-containing protein [Herpetosiphonaceae bacterium]